MYMRTFVAKNKSVWPKINLKVAQHSPFLQGIHSGLPLFTVLVVGSLENMAPAKSDVSYCERARASQSLGGLCLARS